MTNSFFFLITLEKFLSKLWSRSLGVVRKGRMRSQFSIVLVIHKLIEVDINNNDDDDYHNDTTDDNDIS